MTAREPATANVPTVAEALDAVDVVLDRFMHFETAEQRHAVALWAISTWVYDAFEATPYLHIKSPEKRSGKTLLLEILELVVRKPMMTTNFTAAVLFRVVTEQHPTLLIDEADAIFAKRLSADPTSQELRGLLNAGYRKGGKAHRMGGKRFDKVEEFEVFGPKALAGIGDLPDTIADRSIPIALQRKPKTVTKDRFRLRKVKPLTEAIRIVIEAAMSGRSEELADTEPDLPDELSDRQQDSWELLFGVADLAGGAWPQRARSAALRLARDAQDASETIGQQLLADLKGVWRVGEVAVATFVLLERLHTLEEAPWGDWYGRSIDPRFLAQKLKPYGITSTQVKIAGKNHKGYRREHLVPAWSRYVDAPSGTIGATTTTSATSPTHDGISRGYPAATRELPVESGDHGSSLVAAGYLLRNSYRTAEVAEVAPEVPEALPDPEATSQTKADFRTRSGCTEEDVEELWAATCVDHGYPINKALSVDQLAEIRTALDIDQA